MSSLSNSISIARQFLRSVNLEADLGRSDALNGYICQDTASSLIKTMAHHLNETSQRAFTWTGPYGGGKSSLALVLASIVSPNKDLRARAKEILNLDEYSNSAWSSTKDGWLVLPVVGKRESIITAISRALNKTTGEIIRRENSSDLIKRLVDQAQSRKKNGVLLIIDELGKFLESAALNGEDIYFYQELAEAASRCDGKLVIVGVLHQAFEQYATRLGREARDEWAKIQGRYVDIPLVVATDEVVELVGRAIEKKAPPQLKNVSKFVDIVSGCIANRRPNSPSNLKDSLISCWPLHPVTAALLGPISRKRFSQNERSVFGFLASAEPLGFSDFLKSMPNDEFSLYGPARYWDYLVANLEQAILVSADGHRWAVAKDAIERTEARDGCTEIHLSLVKTIALIEMFRAGSGLFSEDSLLEICVEGASRESVRSALADLARWSIIVFRKHLNAWTIYSGSDFDIELSIKQSRAEIASTNIGQLIDLAELNPVVAKRHYHETGTLRWFTRSLINMDDVQSYIDSYSPSQGSSGEFVLVFPNSDFGLKKSKSHIQQFSKLSETKPLVFGFALNSERINELGLEFLALQKVQKTSRELEGDSIARKEVMGRMAAVKVDLGDELKNCFENAIWFYRGQELGKNFSTSLSGIASDLAQETYPFTPIIHNELINHESISGNSVKARRGLMYQMLAKQGESRLGYTGFSSDAGLFYSLIEFNNLYQWVGDRWIFNTNDKTDPIARQFAPIWEAADNILQHSSKPITLTTLYEIWQSPPIGVRKGVLPILALIYFLANRQNLGLYIENTFISDLTDAYLDEWMQDTNRVAFKYVKIGNNEKDLLYSLSQSLSVELRKPIAANPLESARGLVHLVATLPNWTKRTSLISTDAQNFRRVVLKANDPIKVLFSDIPEILNIKNEVELVKKISFLTSELKNAYPEMLNKFRELLYKALDCKEGSSELRTRATNLKGKAGDFQIDGFIATLSVFKDDADSLEALLSTTVHKNPKDWVDRDQEAAINALGSICSTFRQIEALNSLRDGAATRRAFAFVYSDPLKKTISNSFDIAESRIPEIKKVSKSLVKNLMEQGFTKDEIMALFSEASFSIIQKES